MMLDRRLRLIAYFLGGMGVAITLILLGVIFGAWTLSEADKWVKHTAQVEEKIKDARSSYEHAVYLGRRKMLGETFNGELQEERERAFQAIDALKETVSDNNVQMANVDYLKSAVEQRFGVQDEQFASLTRDAFGRMTYPESIVMKSINTDYQVTTTFLQMRNAEGQLMMVERYPRLINWQWRLTYFAGVVVAVLAILIVCVSVMYYNALWRQRKISKKFGKIAQDSSQADGGVIIPKSVLEQIQRDLFDDATPVTE